ncbi:MAG: diaminopimelate epimerase, partial [Alphaproteobacteria bacterium CG11_big_fil_rev_8_21_14_0_20_44_7]
DFVVIDTRNQKFELTPAKAKWIAYRRFGIGCDQVVLLENSEKADIFMRIFNSDGSEVKACGNATRCVGFMLIEELGKDEVTVQTKSNLLTVKRAGADEVTVNMGEPVFDWDKIPLAQDLDVLQLPLSVGPLEEPAAVSMGNPHIVFFVDDIDAINLRAYGPLLEKHEIFPERTNVSVAEINEDNSIRMKVWERGVGKTLACGTAACATLVLAVTLELIEEPKAVVELPGGKLLIEWHEEGYVLMTGKVATPYHGEFDEALFK